MEYGNISNNNIYGTYTGSYDYQTKQQQPHNKDVVKEDSHKNNQDSLTISEEAKKAMSEAKTQMIEISDVKNITGISKSSYSMAFEKTLSLLGTNSDSMIDSSTGLTSNQMEELKNHFEQEEGTRTDTFSRHLNQMTAVYQMMSENIDEKYANPDRETEYYIAEDGSTQELTKEKEQEMLNQAYSDHSECMATSMEIWNDLSGTEMYTRYDSRKTTTYSMPVDNGKNAGEKIVNAKKGEIKNNAYQAFLSAIGGNNISKLMGTEGSWNHVKLDLSISSSHVKDLNKIWDYYADQR